MFIRMTDEIIAGDIRLHDTLLKEQFFAFHTVSFSRDRAGFD